MGALNSHRIGTADWRDADQPHEQAARGRVGRSNLENDGGVKAVEIGIR